MLEGFCRKLNVKILKSESPIYLKRKVNNTYYFIFYLFGCAEDMSIILRELSHSEKAVHNTACFVPVDHAKLGNAHRELTIRVPACFINQTEAGTVHRFYRIAGSVHVGKIHILFIIVQVPALVP